MCREQQYGVYRQAAMVAFINDTNTPDMSLDVALAATRTAKRIECD